MREGLDGGLKVLGHLRRWSPWATSLGPVLLLGRGEMETRNLVRIG